jgi:hypothetical protein
MMLEKLNPNNRPKGTSDMAVVSKKTGALEQPEACSYL